MVCLLYILDNISSKTNYKIHPQFSMRTQVFSIYQAKCEGKVFPVHIMKSHRGSRGTAPLILNLGIRQAVLPPRKNPGTH